MASSRNNALEFSSAGSRILSGSDNETGSFGAIQFLKDSTLNAVTATNVSGTSDLLTSFGAGTIIYGNFTTVGTSAGLVALHRV
jgi:hypothetical protein